MSTNGTTNGHGTKLTGVWALVSTTGGISIICRFAGFKEQSEVEQHLDGTCGPQRWVGIDRAYTLMMIPGMVENKPTLVPVCAPFGQMLDEEQKLGIQISNLVTVAFFDEMSPKTRSSMERHVQRACENAVKLSAASSGLITR